MQAESERLIRQFQDRLDPDLYDGPGGMVHWIKENLLFTLCVGLIGETGHGQAIHYRSDPDLAIRRMDWRLVGQYKVDQTRIWQYVGWIRDWSGNSRPRYGNTQDGLENGSATEE